MFPDRVHGDLRGLLIGEMKFPGGDTAEGHASDPVPLCQLQAGAVAGGQQLPVFWRHPAVDNGADGVQNVVAGQVEGRGELGLPGGFLMALLFDDLRAGKPELYPGEGVNSVRNPYLNYTRY